MNKQYSNVPGDFGVFPKKISAAKQCTLYIQCRVSVKRMDGQSVEWYLKNSPKPEFYTIRISSGKHIFVADYYHMTLGTGIWQGKNNISIEHNFEAGKKYKLEGNMTGGMWGESYDFKLFIFEVNDDGRYKL